MLKFERFKITCAYQLKDVAKRSTLRTEAKTVKDYQNDQTMTANLQKYKNLLLKLTLI